MQKIITYNTLRNFAYSNDHLIKGEIHGIVLRFMGLNFNTILHNDEGDGMDYAAKGLILIVPYYNPWTWMERQTVDFVDEIIEVLCKHHGLPDTIKIVSTGESRGGLCALTYTAYAKITPCACVTNCPVCDLPYHFTERPDLPRTLYSAFGDYEGTMDEALRSASPLHLTEKMPDIPYTIFLCEKDKAVNPTNHAMRFAEAMKPAHNITLHKVPLRGHCDLSSEARHEYTKTIDLAFSC